MSNSAIRCEEIGKRYRIGERESYKALRDTIANAMRAPFRMLGATLRRANGRASSGDNTFWALRDISFDVKPGEVVGLIGRNGAGKSTLLKILSRITEPTEGRARIEGRVGSLLEVGTGFHPELTGRENIYLNGAILGMRKVEIKRRFDEIVAFAEIEKFIDTPVKRYSSGMYVRLAFAVAAHMETEILLVDEVLAVGDANFQQKCLGKMSDVTREGRTVLFVSHNMGAVRRLCKTGIFLSDGQLIAHGPIDSIIDLYSEHHVQSNAEVGYEEDESKVIQILKARLLDHTNSPSTQLDRMRPFKVSVEFVVRERIEGAHIGVMLDKADGLPVCHPADNDTEPQKIIEREPGLYRTTVEFPGAILNAGAYRIRIGIATYSGTIYDYREPFDFGLVDPGTFASIGGTAGQRTGILALSLNWKTEELSGAHV
jgi:lipopolysaccharide transport system ATP-binding protein